MLVIVLPVFRIHRFVHLLCHVMSLCSKFSLSQQEVCSCDMVVLISVQTINDGVSGGNGAGHHLLYYDGVFLLSQMLPGHQR